MSNLGKLEERVARSIGANLAILVIICIKLILLWAGLVALDWMGFIDITIWGELNGKLLET